MLKVLDNISSSLDPKVKGKKRVFAMVYRRLQSRICREIRKLAILSCLILGHGNPF